MDIYSRIGQRIREVRKERGMTQETLAEAADISVPYLSHIERGRKKASLKALIQVAAALDVTVDYLLIDFQPSNKDTFLPEVCELLQDCSVSERRAIFEISKTVKEMLRDTLNV